MELADAKKYKSKIRKLYKEAFPKVERAPLMLLYYKSRDKRAGFYAVMDKGDFTGLVYALRMNKLVYIFYLAVVSEKRGMGYGGKILDEVRKLYPGCTITLAIEDTAHTVAPNYEQRINRLHFYRSNGYRQLGIRINEAGVDFELLGTDDNVTQAQFLAMMRKYFGPVLYRNIYKKTIIEK